MSGATAAWLVTFLVRYAFDATPSRYEGVPLLQTLIAGSIFMGGFATGAFIGWIAVRRRRRSWPTVPFTLPLTLGLLQSPFPFVLQALHDRIIVPYSGIEGLTFFTGLFAGPALAAEVVTRRAGNGPDGRSIIMMPKEDSS